MARSWKLGLLAGAIALGATAIATSGAVASGGGGGGGGGAASMPSVSAPMYDPAAEYAKAIAALKAGQYRDAARAAQHVTEAAPGSSQGWNVLGMAKAGDKDWKGSRRAYEKAVKLAPDDAAAHYGLGLALANLKDQKAQGELDWLKARMQACGDGCADAARLKAMNDEVQGAMAPAQGASAPAQGGGSKPSAALSGPMLFGGPKAGDAAYVQAVSLINEKRYDEALAALAKAEAAFGPHPDIITYEGYAWRKKGDFARAEHYYRQALSITPNHVGATEYFGELKVERGDLAGAKLMLAKLGTVCTYGCAEQEELRRWIDAGHDPHQ